MEIEDSKLISLLKTLNKQEFERLEKYMLSPFFNSSEQMITLFKLLKKDYPDLTSLSREKLFIVFYPNEAYKDKKVRDLFNRMLEIVMGFLAQLEFEKNRHLENIFTMNQLINRGLERHYKSKFKESEKKLKDELIIDEELLLNEYSFSKLNKQFIDIFSNGVYEESLSELLFLEYDHFLNYAIYIILQYALMFSIRRYAVNNEVNIEFLDNVIEFLDRHPRDKYPVIFILKNVLLLQKRENENLTDNDTAIYQNLIKQLDENAHTLKQEDKRSIYIYLANYTRLRSLAGNKYYKEEHYRILKYSIENDLYPKEGNYFSEASYGVVASTALMNKDFKWAEEFIEKFKHELKKEVRENVYTLCKANLSYRTGKHEEALKYLVRVSIDDIYYQLKVKNLQIKIHYELGNYETCKSFIDSFRHFLGSVKQFPEFVRIRFVNYVNFTSRMVNVWLGGDPKNMKEINREIKEIPTEKVESKSWLLAQAEKIKY
ncbi:MAG: hypothetical protein ABI543_10615 [Ignavibacteria bacterium]